MDSQRLRYYNSENLLPGEPDLTRITAAASITAPELALRLGKIDHRLAEELRKHASEIASLLEPSLTTPDGPPTPPVVFETELGRLHHGDCLDLLPSLPDESVDLVFADPPFNLNKLYPSGIDDDLRTRQYVEWSERWLDECARLLTFGGSLFLWNLPKWNIRFAEFLSQRLVFRHWIAIDIKYSLPISGRLYPSHYSLLYFTKGGKPNVFAPDRLPMPVCPSCAADLRDYGGYKHKMNPRGVNLTDVWFDIPPVRHPKYKRRAGANELSIKLLDRVIEMATKPGQVVLDPFGGAGTTYAVAELKGRRWLGIEIGPPDDILDRFARLGEERGYLTQHRQDLNCLFTESTKSKRNQLGLWTDETVKPPKSRAGGGS